MTTFVLVPGGWHGSWSFEAVVPLLERAGHTVHALTLTGLRPDDDHAAVATANLDTHADDVLRLLDCAHITDATLVGHSYGGMVIAAAADRAGGRVSRLVHLDAYVPRDGESCWSQTTERYRQAFAAGAATDGYAVRPPAGLDPRTRPHPLASFLQAIRLTGALARVPRREFIYCSGWDGTPFAELRDRLQSDPEWQVHDLPTGHDALHEAPAAVAALLLGERVTHTPTTRTGLTSNHVPMMRAVVAERPAGSDGLAVREVPRPDPRPGWALVRVEAFGLNRSEYKTLKGYAGDAVTFPRILGIELVGVVEAVAGDAPAVAPGTTVAALMGGMGRAFDGSYAEYALVPEHQLIAIDTKLPWHVLGALPETYVTAAGSLAHLELPAGATLLLRGATSSVGLACLALARAAGVRVVATTRSECKRRRLAELGAADTVLEGDGFAQRAAAALPDDGADAAVDLIGGPSVLTTLGLLRPGATACNSGSLSNTWIIPDFEPIAMIPSGRKLTVFHSDEAHHARDGGPLLRAVIEKVERGEISPNIDAVYTLEQTIDAHRRMAADNATGKLVVLPHSLT
jgi:NADPH:quinone reductase-like Zn-dependent oxidoreductase/pimeloyl-ACP methyl ester carboxylesterase